jgi:hypothetical protein
LACKPILWKKSLANLDQMEIINMAQKKTTHEPATLDGKTLRVLPTPQLKLATIDDCRREMARVYRDARTGAVDTTEASRLVYMLTSIAKMIEIGQLEQRLKVLEENQHGNS